MARAMLDTCYSWLDNVVHRAWAVGEGFTLDDCAAAPVLFYADLVHPVGDAVPNVAAYHAQLLARPSVRRAVNDARPYRRLFPGGARTAIEDHRSVEGPPDATCDFCDPGDQIVARSRVEINPVVVYRVLRRSGDQ
jgi:hypothetical protein